MLIQILDYFVDEVIEIDDAYISEVEKIDDKYSIIWNTDGIAYKVDNRILYAMGIQ